MFIDKDIQADFKELLTKAIDANEKLLIDAKNLSYEDRMNIVGSVTYNIKCLNETING